MSRNLIKKLIAEPFSEAEAIYASEAKEEIAAAIKALLAVSERGCCNPKLPKQLLRTVELLEVEVETNHQVMTRFLEQIDQPTTI
jgi:hypothetical protein